MKVLARMMAILSFIRVEKSLPCGLLDASAALLQQNLHLPNLENIVTKFGGCPRACKVCSPSGHSRVHLGPFGRWPQGANGPQSVTQAINLPFFAMAKLLFFAQKNGKKKVLASPRPCGCWGWLVGTPAPNLACPMPLGAAKNEGVLVILSLKLLQCTSYSGRRRQDTRCRKLRRRCCCGAAGPGPPGHPRPPDKRTADSDPMRSGQHVRTRFGL